MGDRYIDPNSGAAPQPGGLVSRPLSDEERGIVAEPQVTEPEQADVPDETTGDATADTTADGTDGTDGTADATPATEPGDGTTGDTENTEQTTEATTEATTEQTGEPQADQYDDKSVWSYADLQKEIQRRSDQGESISAQGSREELVERLRAADAAK